MKKLGQPVPDLYLASDLSTYVTGQNIEVAGGFNGHALCQSCLGECSIQRGDAAVDLVGNLALGLALGKTLDVELGASLDAEPSAEMDIGN